MQANNEPRRFERVAFLRPGTYTDALGRRAVFAAGDLQRMAADFDAADFSPPLTIDHAQGGPAHGWVSSLHWDGRMLYADLQSVPAQLAEEIDSMRFRYRSAEVIPGRDGEAPKLRALTLLGARPPAVKGLPDMPKSIAGGKPAPMQGRAGAYSQTTKAAMQCGSQVQPHVLKLNPVSH